MLLNTTNNSPLSLAREMDRLFDSMVSTQPFGFVPRSRGPWISPAINLWEHDDHLHAEAELPGFKMDDVEVLVTDDQLTLRGARHVPVPEEGRPLRRERAIVSFERTIDLPVSIDTERVEAKLTHGVLLITLPKAEASRPRKISVRALPDAS
ncbi:MAG: Hsp20/alpha crystallin family protein [Planctomycetota bacterium]|jgi:HSP20 family protein